MKKILAIAICRHLLGQDVDNPVGFGEKGLYCHCALTALGVQLLKKRSTFSLLYPLPSSRKLES